MYSNCLLWALKIKLRWGGKILWIKSKTWIGFHNRWVNQDGIVWEYTIENQKKQPWWYVPILYKGVVKKVKKTS